MGPGHDSQRSDGKVTVRDELMRSQVCKRDVEIFDLSDRWRSEAEGKGWA